ncbi:response regulator transcription factor [Olivibacter sp. XZL3]|uniref:response regulator transcription factor n=1 Tax=Olivibacter sp. XZL3 TaxID=1735116 RepID=UPI001065A055|nr:response regulator transcription factor [Olivibacter sp. XZL3]
MMSLLLIEDETDLGLIIADNLRSAQYDVSHCVNGEHGLSLYYQLKPEVVILDVMLPGMDGFAIARKIREVDAETPILFLTARTQTADVVNAFELGANDYLRKPFSIEELKVRINALVQRNQWQNQKRFLQIGAYAMDTMRQTLKDKDGLEVNLSFRECELIKMLYENKNKVIHRQDIIHAVWPHDRFFTGRSLDVFISRIRSYLQKDSSISIVNIRAVGYKMIV